MLLMVTRQYQVFKKWRSTESQITWVLHWVGVNFSQPSGNTLSWIRLRPLKRR